MKQTSRSKTKTVTKKRSVITDKPVMEKTGHDLGHWYAVLDKKGALEMSMEKIYEVAFALPGLKNLSEWNRGLLATSYAWSRGIRERGEKKDGFEVSVSKTVGVPVEVLFESLVNEKIRSKWLSEKIEIRKSTPNRSARITWSDGTSSLSVDLYEKGPDKSQIVVQHLKLPDSKKCGEMKVLWGKKLENLKSLLEK
jgi:hypothetical protein